MRSKTVASSFCAGAHVRTAQGDVLVQDLKPGDLVLTVSGDTRPFTRFIRTRLHQPISRLRPTIGLSESRPMLSATTAHHATCMFRPPSEFASMVPTAKF